MHTEKKSTHCAQLLSQTLADTYVLYVKTQNFHWNVIDPRFHSLHEFLEEQYQELALAVDELAERIRMLQFRAPGSMREFLELSNLNESSQEMDADEMLQSLLTDHDHLITQIKEQIEEATKLGDEGTADLLVQRLRAHEKAAWMLRSQLSA